jgi:hypothetical protein
MVDEPADRFDPLVLTVEWPAPGMVQTFPVQEISDQAIALGEPGRRVADEESA